MDKKMTAVVLASLTAIGLIGAAADAARSKGKTRVAVARPDLVVSAVKIAPASLEQGTLVRIRTTVANRGFVFAPATETRAWLSKDAARSSNDIRLGSSATPRIANSSSTLVTGWYMVPARLAAGRYFVISCADVKGAVKERSDSNNCRASKTRLTVTPTPPDMAPIAKLDARTVPEDTTINLSIAGLLENDSDPEGKQVRFVGAGSPSNGTLTVNGNVVAFTPAANFNGAAGFDYTITDGVRLSAARVSITVTPVNDAPTAVDDASSTEEDVAKVLTSDYLVANDRDVDRDTLRVVSVDNPVNGSVALSSGAVTFTPAANFSGIAGFDYTMSDGTMSSGGRVNIAVSPVNDAPVAVDDTVVAAEGTNLQLPVAPFLANDTDIDSTTLTLTLLGSVNGQVSLVNGNTIVFSPNPYFAGEAAFDYAVSDGVLTDVGRVVITFTPVNDPPSAGPDSAQTQKNMKLTLQAATLLANDSDPDAGTTLTITGVSAASRAGGTVKLEGNEVIFDPEPAFTGSDEFTYTVSDGTATATATVTVEVVPQETPTQ